MRVDLILIYVFCRIMVLLLGEWLNWQKDLLTRFLFLSVSKESAKEFRRLGAILRHCLISRADGEEQTEEFHR